MAAGGVAPTGASGMSGLWVATGARDVVRVVSGKSGTAWFGGGKGHSRDMVRGVGLPSLWDGGCVHVRPLAYLRGRAEGGPHGPPGQGQAAVVR